MTDLRLCVLEDTFRVFATYSNDAIPSVQVRQSMRSAINITVYRKVNCKQKYVEHSRSSTRANCMRMETENDI